MGQPNTFAGCTLPKDHQFLTSGPSLGSGFILFVYARGSEPLLERTTTHKAKQYLRSHFYVYSQKSVRWDIECSGITGSRFVFEDEVFIFVLKSRILSVDYLFHSLSKFGRIRISDFPKWENIKLSPLAWKQRYYFQNFLYVFPNFSSHNYT